MSKKNIQIAQQLVSLAASLVHAATPFFKTMNEALEYAVNDIQKILLKKKLTLDPEDLSNDWMFSPVDYETNVQKRTPLKDVNGKIKSYLIINLYRMPSGNYELTHYVS
jgi:hypothetical protein